MNITLEDRAQLPQPELEQASARETRARHQDLHEMAWHSCQEGVLAKRSCSEHLA